MMIKSLPGTSAPGASVEVTDTAELENFYGRSRDLAVKYVREKKRVDYGKANDDEYEFEMVASKKSGDAT